MECKIMTMAEAKKVCSDDSIVLVFNRDLEKSDCNEGFKKKRFHECHKYLDDAETIGWLSDNFIDQLRVFSKKQTDIIKYVPKGKMKTILLL